MTYKLEVPLLISLLGGLLGAGCAAAVGDDATDEDATHVDEVGAERRAADVNLVPRAGIVPLAITDDDHVLYQDGTGVFATALSPWARPTHVAEVPAGNTAFVFTAGKVAFVWTNPDQSSPSLGVSPLVIWTARHGARALSEASAVGTLLTAADADGARVVFPSHATAAGTIGDVVEATTDGREVRTLLTGIQTDFSNGPCRPLGVLLGEGRGAYPAISACAGADTTSTLSVFAPGGRLDVPGLTNPPRLAADPQRRRLLVARASATNPRSGTPLLIADGRVTPLEDTTAGFAFFTPDGAAIYFVRDASGLGVHRARTRGGAPVIASLATGVAGLYGSGFGSVALTHPISSRDGRALAIATASDPQTGLTNVAIADLRAATPSIRLIDDGLESTTVTPAEPFTADSRYVLYGKLDLNTGTAQMFAGALATGAHHAIGAAGGITALPAAGSLVAIGDTFTPDPTNPARSTVAVRVVDAADPGAASRQLSASANATFFVDHRGGHVIYATDAAGAAGLHVARAR